MNRFFSHCPLAPVLAALSVLALSAPAQAGERPHKSRGTAQFVSANDFVGAGRATHLGNYTEVGNVSISQTGAVTGWSIYTAATGDQLHATISGQINATGVVTATVTYVGGTGRFDDASGSATLTGQILPDGTLTVAVNGTVDY